MVSGQRGTVGIGEVARAAGVSNGTVSNVLNHPSRVNADTATRVHEAIQRLGYVRNGIASQLRAGTRTTVGSIVLDIRNPFFTDVTRGIEDHLATADFTLMTASSDGDVVREQRFLRLFEEQGVGGVVVVPAGEDVQRLVELAGRGTPVVVLDVSLPGSSLSSVSVDDVEGGRLALEHLLAQGYERIDVVTGAAEVRQTRDRLRGARLACESHGLDPDRVLSVRTARTLDSAGAEEAIGRLVDESGTCPHAVFAMNDLMAIGVQRALRRRELYEPGRTAVVGYDDIDLAAELLVPLTSIRQPTHALGARAAEILLAPASQEAEQVVFQPELVVRESSLGTARR